MKKMISLLLLVITFSGFAQSESKRVKEFNLENKVAIKGYDPVSYFEQERGIRGKKALSLVYKGVKYYFYSEANKELFLKNPADYEPQYGGWCAYAMGDSGDKVEVDPETFKIVDGKLYLFYNAYFTNTLKKWNTNESALKSKADKNWKK